MADYTGNPGRQDDQVAHLIAEIRRRDEVISLLEKKVEQLQAEWSEIFAAGQRSTMNAADTVPAQRDGTDRPRLRVIKGGLGVGIAAALASEAWRLIRSHPVAAGAAALTTAMGTAAVTVPVLLAPAVHTGAAVPLRVPYSSTAPRQPGTAATPRASSAPHRRTVTVTTVPVTGSPAPRPSAAAPSQGTDGTGTADPTPAPAPTPTVSRTAVPEPSPDPSPSSAAPSSSPSSAAPSSAASSPASSSSSPPPVVSVGGGCLIYLLGICI